MKENNHSKVLSGFQMLMVVSPLPRKGEMDFYACDSVPICMETKKSLLFFGSQESISCGSYIVSIFELEDANLIHIQEGGRGRKMRSHRGQPVQPRSIKAFTIKKLYSIRWSVRIILESSIIQKNSFFNSKQQEVINGFEEFYST